MRYATKAHGQERLRRRAAVAGALGLALAVTAVSDPSSATTKPRGPAAAHTAVRPPTPTLLAAGDEVVTGVGDTGGYHVYAASSGDGWAWRPLASVQPGGYSDERWIGRQCLTGDGREVVAVVAPWHAANSPDGMDAGGYAYAIDAHTGRVKPLASGVSLAYFDPGCGADSRAVLTRYTSRDEGTTQVLRVDADTGTVNPSGRFSGELTSAVPVAGAVVAVRGDSLVRLSGGVEQHLADLPGQPFDLRPNAAGGLDLLVREKAATAGLWRLAASGTVSRLGSGALTSAALYGGRGGRTMVAGVRLNPGVSAAPSVLRSTAEAVSEDGTAQLNAAARSGAAPLAQGEPAGATVLRAADSGRVLTDSVPPPGPAVTRDVPAYAGVTNAAVTSTQAPACAVPRDDVTLQVPQPGAAQIDWAAQQAARGQLTAPRPDGIWGLPASAPSSDFPLPAPFSAVTHPVPREVVEAVMAQESNWSQASWHAVPGLAGNPLIADYYGYNASGTIDYSQADCGYGLGQLTSIMTAGAVDPYTGVAVPPAVQKKVAVDYAENTAATAYFLARKWNDVTAVGIVANNGDPSMLENWYFAIWAYNTGLHPYSSTQPWGLGWLNNPINPIYPANRTAFLENSYGDASHPGDWPYQERVMGWMGVPLGGSNGADYARSGKYPLLPTYLMFCSTSVNQCDPLDPNKAYCQRSDDECWWHANQTWVGDCATACTTGYFNLSTATAEPSAPANPHPPVCNSTLPSNAVIVNDQPGDVNLAGCTSPNWHSAGSFQASFGTDASGQPLGVVDWHQLGAGFGGHLWFTHTRQSGEPNAVSGTWTPSSLTTGTYNVKVFVPDTGAGAAEATYTIWPGNGHAPVQRTIDQFTAANAWVGLGDFTLYPGASVVLSSVTADGNDATDIAFSAVAFVPVSGTLVHHSVDAVSIFQPTQNVDTGLDSVLKSILISQNAVTQWATGETSAAAGLPACTGTPTANCITPAVKSSFSTWAASIAAEPTAVWLGLANPALPSPVPAGWFDDPTHYKTQTHFDVDFMVRSNGSIDPGSVDVTGVNRTGDTELAPFILPFMNAVASDYGIAAPDLSYAAPNLNTYNDVSTSVDLNATGLAPGRNYLSYVEPPALADNNTCLSLAAMEGGADGYKPLVNDPGVDASTAAWVAAIYAGYQNNKIPKVVWDTAANIVEAFFHPISKNLLEQFGSFLSAPLSPFDPHGSIFTMAPGIWAEPHLKLCTGSALVKPDGGADPAGIQTTADNSYMPDLYLLVDNQLYDAFGAKTTRPINTGDWKTFSAPPWQAAPNPTPWNTCYIGPALPPPQQTFPNAPFIDRRDGNPFDLHLLDSPGERGNSVALCDRLQEGTHYDNPQP